MFMSASCFSLFIYPKPDDILSLQLNVGIKAYIYYLCVILRAELTVAVYSSTEPTCLRAGIARISLSVITGCTGRLEVV